MPGAVHTLPLKLPPLAIHVRSLVIPPLAVAVKLIWPGREGLIRWRNRGDRHAGWRDQTSGGNNISISVRNGQRVGFARRSAAELDTNHRSTADVEISELPLPSNR